jgi:cysteine desulfurase
VTRIYLDHAATTPLRPEVRKAMLPWLDHGGNPSSLHAEGRRARAAIDLAREQVANRLGCEFAEVVFTSGGTEACNLALVGRALANEDSSRRRILISAAEHACVWATAPLLRRLGYSVEFIPVDRYARPILPQLTDDVLLVSAMAANNELGTLSPVEEIAQATRAVGATYFCDAVQMPGPADADLVAIAGHKMGGPRGVGVLVVRAGSRIAPFVAGGAQERERRGGTEDVAAIVGLGAACTLDYLNLTPIRNAFLDRLSFNHGPSFINSLDSALCLPSALPSHAHLRFPGVDAETLLLALDRAGVAASAGSACASGSLEPSHVLLACGWTPQEAKEGLRFTFGWDNTIEQALEAANRVSEVVTKLQGRTQPPDDLMT